MSDRSIIDHLRLARTESVGPITYRRLLERFGTPAEALAALPDLARMGGASRLCAYPPQPKSSANTPP